MDGERALVTGSTSGIGRAVAIAFAREGACVTVTGRDQERGNAVAEEIARAGGVAHFVAADLDDEHACTALVDEAAARLGGLTVLVNNAARGGAADGPVAELTTEAWDAILRIDLTAPMWCRARRDPPSARGRARLDRQRVVAAGRARESGPGCLYRGQVGAERLDPCNSRRRGPARHSLQHDQPRLRVERSPRRRHLRSTRRARFEGMHLTRLGTADDVAHAAVYLASRESEFVTGINLELDGGSSIARGLTLG